jgi:cellulose synthase/poly-beta-1,6-N-acetylglucosamine synthase-like glycosyltransferase
VVYCKAARAWTTVPDSLRRVLRRNRWKKSFIRNVFFTGSFYWRKPLIPALFYYLHVVFVLVGPIISFRHLVYMPLHGEVLSALLYLAGIMFVGLVFGIAFKLEDRRARNWMYRPLMSLLSTFVLSWLIFYSVLTIRKMKWARD